VLSYQVIKLQAFNKGLNKWTVACNVISRGASKDGNKLAYGTTLKEGSTMMQVWPTRNAEVRQPTG